MDQTPRRGIRALASMLPKVTAPIFKKRGFAEAGILTDWAAIVGPHLAAHTMPEKIAFPRNARSAGTLHIVTESAFAPELQHLEPQVIERINGYFGYHAVERLRIAHGRVIAVEARAKANRASSGAKRATGAPQGTGHTPADQASLAAAKQPMGVEDEALRAALARLGQAVADRGDKPAS